MLCKPSPWGRLRGLLSLNPEQALRMFGFTMNPEAHGVIFRQYTYLDDNGHPRTGTFISNYFPASNPQTPVQQTNRAKMTLAVIAWQDLKEEEKKEWNRRAWGRHMSGFNLHNSYHLRGIEY